MINVRKGTAHSLLQSDVVGNAKANEAVVAGMICYLDAAGDIVKGCSGTAANDLLGFAINNQDDGDVIESGKIGLYQLDGNSVIETDQAAATINATNYPVGTALYATTGGTGTVTTTNTTSRIIGHVNGIRNIPSVETVSGVKIQSTRALLGIKLAS